MAELKNFAGKRGEEAMKTVTEILYGAAAVYLTAAALKGLVLLSADWKARGAGIAALRGQMERAVADISERAQRLEELRVLTAESRAMERQLVIDAVNREMRAKAALEAVMRAQGCGAADIAFVIDKIDSPENG